MTTRAYELRDKVSEVERLYIEARYYTTVQTDVQKALDTYKVWLATYPNDYTALTNSALLHKQQGDRAEAIRKLELATKVAPDQPLGLDQPRSDLLRDAASMPKRGRRTRRAIKLQDSTGARVGLYQIAILMGDTALGRATGRRRPRPPRRSGHGRDPHVRRDVSRPHEGSGRACRRLPGARDRAQPRRRTPATAIMQLAISEALVGLIDQAKARVDKAEDDGILDENTVDDRMVVAAITKDRGDGARADAARRSRSRRRTAATIRQAVGRRARDQGAGGAGGRQAGRSGDADRAGAVRCRRTPTSCNIWTIAKMQTEDLAGGGEGPDVPELARRAQRPERDRPRYAFATLARVQVKMGQQGRSAQELPEVLRALQGRRSGSAALSKP